MKESFRKIIEPEPFGLPDELWGLFRRCDHFLYRPDQKHTTDEHLPRTRRLETHEARSQGPSTCPTCLKTHKDGSQGPVLLVATVGPALHVERVSPLPEARSLEHVR